MLERLLPRRIDNAHHGGRLALWVFALLLLLKTAMSVNSVFNGRRVVSSADGVPLDAYPAAAAETIVSLFTLLGVSNFTVCLLCALVLFRYRAMLPLTFALLLFEHAGRRLALLFLPIPRAGAPPARLINLVILALLVVGLALSLRRGDDRQARE